jgi:hypothetical protein
MSYTYTSFITTLANFLVIPTSDTNFIQAIPAIIDDAEQKIYRDLQLLNTIVRDSTGALTAGNRNFSLPTDQGVFLITENFNVITPAGTSNPELGTRNPLLPASKETLDYLWPAVIGSTVPVYFAPITQGTFIVGPWPDQNYTIEVVGTQRPAPLSATNTTTLLSTYLPDLFMCASLIMGAGFLKNFGAATDDPQSGVTWSTKYDQALASAKTEEFLKKFQGQGWSSEDTSPTVTPTRT